MLLDTTITLQIPTAQTLTMQTLTAQSLTIQALTVQNLTTRTPRVPIPTAQTWVAEADGIEMVKSQISTT